MAEPEQPLNINKLHNVYVVKELIQLTVGSNAEIIANSLWIEILRSTFLLNTLKVDASVLNRFHSSVPSPNILG